MHVCLSSRSEKVERAKEDQSDLYADAFVLMLCKYTIYYICIHISVCVGVCVGVCAGGVGISHRASGLSNPTSGNLSRRAHQSRIPHYEIARTRGGRNFVEWNTEPTTLPINSYTLLLFFLSFLSLTFSS